MRILSIEIGIDVTHVAEMDYKVKTPKLQKSFSFQTPMGVVGEAGVRKNEEFRTLLNKLLDANRVKTRKVLFVINSGKIASREVELPPVKENRIRGLLNANSTEYFPVDLAQYQLVYRLAAPLTPEAQKSKNRKLSVFAVPNELITSYEELASFCSLELTALDYVGNSVHQLMRRAVGGSLACSVKVDENATMITIIRQGEVMLQRTFFYGVGEAYTLIEEAGMSAGKGYSGIQELTEKELCLNPRMDMQMQDADNNMGALRDEVTESLRPMIGNISRVLDYYQSRNAGAEIGECILIGNGARMKGLDTLMARELNLPVRVMEPERLGSLQIASGTAMTEYFACYGAALEPLEFVFGEEQTAKIIQAKKKREMMVFRLFTIVCVLGAAVLVGMEGLSYLSRKGQIRKLNSEKEALSYIQTIYDTYVSTLARYKDVVTMEEHTRTVSDGLADAFAEMEMKLPSDIRVESLTTDGQGISMDIKVNSKEEAAKTLEALRSFTAFRSVQTGGITEVTDETGNTTVSFSVMCIYVNGSADTELEGETTPEEDVETYLDGDAYIHPDYGSDNTETEDAGDE